MLAGQLVVHGLTAGVEGIPDVRVELVQVARQQARIEFDRDVATCAERAVVSLADFFGQTDVQG